jgi:hypothetical protein
MGWNLVCSASRRTLRIIVIDMQRRGLSIAFLGVDGIGKTTLANQLRKNLDRNGIASTVMSWRRHLKKGCDHHLTEYPLAALQELWVEKFRLARAGAHDDSGTELSMARSYVEHVRMSVESSLEETELYGIQRSGALAAAWVELAGNFILQAECIERQTASGLITIQDTFGFKHVLKLLLIAKALHSDGMPTEVVDDCIETATRVFGGPYLQPAIGVFLKGSPELAYKWRQAGRAEPRGLEDYSVAGWGGKESFLKLQRECAEYFKNAAQSWGWLIIDVDERPLREMIEAEINGIISHPALAAMMQ